MKGDDPEMNTVQTPKRFGKGLALQEKIRKTFSDSILNKFGVLKLKIAKLTIFSNLITILGSFMNLRAFKP